MPSALTAEVEEGKLQEIGDQQRNHEGRSHLLRWRICRANLARNILLELRISYKNGQPLFCVGEKNPAKFPPDFPQNLAKNEKITQSFCRSAGRTYLQWGGKCTLDLLGFIAVGSFMGSFMGLGFSFPRLSLTREQGQKSSSWSVAFCWRWAQRKWAPAVASEA